MVQKFEFTTAAMAASLEDTGVTYEQLEDLAAEFEDVEAEIRELRCMFHGSQGNLGLTINSSPSSGSAAQTTLREAQQTRLTHPQLLAAGDRAGPARD
jgi:hypothetical protein